MKLSKKEEFPLKVGDKVRIKSDLEEDKAYFQWEGSALKFITNMVEYKGKEAVITYIDPDKTFKIDLDESHWYSLGMVEQIKEPSFTVSKGDIITFWTSKYSNLVYKVTGYCLEIIDDFYNYQIFSELEIPNKEEFCTSAYGYTSLGGQFPQYHSCDWNAAARVIAALGAYCYKVTCNGGNVLVDNSDTVHSIETSSELPSYNKDFYIDFDCSDFEFIESTNSYYF